MYVIAIGWLYVIVLMALTAGSVVSGLAILFFFGVLPVGLVLWLNGTRRASRVGKKVLGQPDRADSERDERDLLRSRAQLRPPMQAGDEVGDRNVEHG
jgi:hypothetical protein